jgi:putative sterol carrier protein
LPSLGAISLALKAFFHPEQARDINENYELRFGAEALQVQIWDGELHVKQGQARQPAVVIHTDMPTFLVLFTGQLKPAEAMAGGLIQVEGYPEALGRFLQYCSVPTPSPTVEPTRA